MDIKIEADTEGNGCKVWLGNQPVSFKNRQDAERYIAQLQERINAAPPVFKDMPKREAVLS